MLRNYLRIAWAVFCRRKFFTFISLFGITFTLAILLVTTAVLDHLFGGVPPEVNQRRTLGVFSCMLSGQQGQSFSPLSYSVLDQHLRGLPGAESVSITSFIRTVTSYTQHGRVESYLKLADAEFWQIMRFDFLEGRPFTNDEVDTASRVAVINRATRARFFADQPAAGQMIEVDGASYRVVGVVEDVPFFRLLPFADIWVPTSTDERSRSSHAVLGSFVGVILAESRNDFAAIREEFISRMATVDLSVEGDYDTLVAVPETPFQLVSRVLFARGQSTESHATSLLMVIVVLMVLFMILPTINLINLNISRIMERASEIGIRKAFGAPSTSLVGQFIVENLLLTLAGALLAIALAKGVLVLFEASGLIPYASFHLNTRIFIYALLTAVFFGLFSGVYPAWRMSRMKPVDALRGGIS